ncbi:glycosyltransferase [Candidatus Thorarchaeota archaeon]|nr:MAG: glycosyltransferase [Candidatus Thorarchaeota archaeon]
MTKVAYLSSYAPRECGIATFTENLTSNINSLHILGPAVIIAVNEAESYYSYGSEVAYQIDEEDKKSYIETAHQINDSDLDLVNVQHEFGLFGGVWGNYLLTFLDNLEKPIVTTMHTTLSPDSRRLKSLGEVATHNKMVKEIGKKSSAIVVMTQMAADILQNGYGVDANKIRIIPHGCPSMPFVPSDHEKKELGLEDRLVLSTFGLLSRDKGIQNAIKALPDLTRDWPEILYLVIGETHPQVRLREGERYRKRLMKLVKHLGLRKNVKFHNRFLSEDKLIKYLLATDVYICPYTKKDQLSSGTVTYALGAGRAIVSTPFNYAQEVLGEGRAVLCKFRSPGSITKAVRSLLEDPEKKARIEKLAYDYSRSMTWPSVASSYVSLFEQVVQ